MWLKKDSYLRFFTLLTLSVLVLGVSVLATTTISDNRIFTTGSVNASNIIFGNTTGSLGETAPNRPFVSNYETNFTVCSIGCNYNSIQDAIDQVPLLLRHKYTIQIKNGNYNENLYIPPIMVSRTSSTEGSIVGLEIEGNTSNDRGVNITSIQISGVVGAWGVDINHLTITGQEPYSDENASISIYGSNSVLLRNITFISNVDYGVLSYSSGVYIHSSEFHNQSNGIYVKRGGFGQFGDNLNNQSNKGQVLNYLGAVSDGFLVINGKNPVTYGGGGTSDDLINCGDGGSSTNGIAIFNNSIYCPRRISSTLTIGQNGYGDGVLTLISNSSSASSFIIRPFGCSGCSGTSFSRIETSSSSNRTINFANTAGGDLNINMVDGLLSLQRLSGTGNALACINASGSLYRGNETACP